MLRNQPLSARSIKNILLIRIDHLGDALLLRPAIAELRKAQPQMKIDVLTTPENFPIFQSDPFIDNVIVFHGHWFQKTASPVQKIRSFFSIRRRIKTGNYDAAIDFRGDVRANALMFAAGIPIRMGYGLTGGGWMLTHEKESNDSQHQVNVNCEMLKEWIRPEEALKNPPVYYPANTFAQLQEKISGLRWPYAVIHVGAGNPLKEWPAGHFADLMQRLLRSGLVKNFFLIGTDTERKRIPAPAGENIIDLRGLTDLHELSCLLEGASFFAGNDSGPAHLAAAQGIPVVVLASHTNNIKTWHPWTKRLCILSAPPGKLVSVEKAEAGVLSLISQGS